MAIASNGSDATFTDAVSVDHHQCRLGKWYDRDGRDRFGGIPSYAALERPHARVHESVHRMLTHLGQGWEERLEVQGAILQSMGDAENASREVMGLVDRMIEEKHSV